MIKISDLKFTAKESLKGNWGGAIAAMLIYELIAAALSATAVGFVFAGLLMVGYAAFNMHLIRTRTSKVDTLLSCVQTEFGTKLVASLLIFLYTFLWSLLLIIPGIVKSYSYRMTYYILNDHPEMSHDAAIKESCSMMNGYKMKLFLLDLSFIGWMLLSALTFGILLIYVVPYMNATVAAFYENLIAQKETRAEQIY